MDFEDKILAKGVPSFSSSVQSTPEKNGNSEDASGSPEFVQEFLKSGPKKELLRACFNKDKKHSASSKSRTDQLKNCIKITKKQDSKKNGSAPCNPPPMKQQRKCENPTRLLNTSENPQDSWICKNSACRAVVPLDDSFCKRCSCYICHLFDDNKDPSLWLVCLSDKHEADSCGLSCHIECALQNEKAGVADLGQFMQLDGTYCCSSCGKISGILSCWKKQIMIAKDARRLDIFCYRIYLSFRLLNGTSRFKEIHDLVCQAKAKLETEVGPLDALSEKMPRGLVSRLSIASEVQKLCSLAIEKADEFMEKQNHGISHSLPSACKFIFEKVTSSSVSIILINHSLEVKGYKLWYCKSKEEKHTKEPNFVFPNFQRRILISNLQPCSQYSFRIVSYTETGDLGHSESLCFTESKEILKHSKFSSVSRQLDLNVASIPDLNEDLDEENDGVEELHDCDSTLINGSPFRASSTSGLLDENFEYCVKIIRWLECEGYIDKEFRLKLLTWFSLRSTEQERRVVNTFIQTLIDDPGSLAGQLVDSFTEIISSKRERNGFCSKLWH